MATIDLMPAKTLKVAAVQMMFAPAIEANIRQIEDALTSLKRRQVDVALFPECCTTGYNCNFGKIKPSDIEPAIDRLQALAAKNCINLLIGTPLFRRRKLQNCLLVVDRKGRVEHCYAKCQLTSADRRYFTPGNHIALFKIDGITCTSIICHERRYPELVRLAAMAGAQVVFHPNAGLDTLAVSKTKRNGNDGIAVRAFENAIHYVFANSVGPQGKGKWSAGDSKIVDAAGKRLRLANNESSEIITAEISVAQASRKYAQDSLRYPRFLVPRWRSLVAEVKARAASEGSYSH